MASVGHDEVGYYYVPGGFALTTRLERMDDDGAPVLTDRWILSVARPDVSWSLIGYIQALTTATVGHFRVLTFVVTDQPFSPSDEPADTATIREWAVLGENVLPREVREQPFGDGVEVTALVYEMSKTRGARDVVVHVPGHLLAAQHLRKLGVVAALEAPR